MTKEYGTLKELGVKPGDVVSFDDGKFRHRITSFNGKYADTTISGGKKGLISNTGASPWYIVSRAYDDRNLTYDTATEEDLQGVIDMTVNTPKLWRDMTPEEKGALLLAKHEGKVIEWTGRGGGEFSKSTSEGFTPVWSDGHAYRVQPPAPKVDTVAIFIDSRIGYGLLKIGTIDLIDGEPDLSSIKMEKL